MSLIIQPPRSAFWRFVFATACALALLAIWDLTELARRLGINILTGSKTWLFFLALLILLALLALLGLAIGFSKARDKFWVRLEAMGEIRKSGRWIGILLTCVSLIGFSSVIAIPYFKRALGGEEGVRFLIFWMFSLIGMWGIKLLRGQTPWFSALITIVLLQSVLHLLFVYLPLITAYPFAMGWSETSRYYFPSLYLSQLVYGREYPWPILHPTLHLMLTPPYLFDAPLWVHRLWHVALRVLLPGAIVPLLLRRLSVPGRTFHWVVGLWMFLFLFMGPVYFHLAVPVMILLVGFSHHDDRRTWVAVLLASLWCGWSRVNWYPMPGMLAAVLYLMEAPFKGRSLRGYMVKPALWFVIGTLVAFLSQRVYIALSGVPDSGLFYTSLTSDLLWYRLLPNASYSLGILPAALLAFVPVWFAMFMILRSHRADWHPLRLTLIFSALFVLFVGGLIVSVKIGGGTNLHNLDAHFSLLLIVFAYLVFGRYKREDGELASPVSLHWLVVVSLVVVPAWSWLQLNIGFKSYDPARTQTVLTDLQEYVDRANAEGGEILFITQRQLISMHMLKNVTLVPEYEREDLMEMAMANNSQYLGKFRRDMEAQRFALIVVDPLNFNIMTKNRSFAEENNVWVRRVMKHILCNYREEIIFPEDEIALYVPQVGERQCPQF